MTVDERFDRLDQAIAANNRAIATLTQNLDRLTEYVLEFRRETATRFQLIENRLDILTSTVANIENRLPGLTKAILDFGTISNHIVREQSSQKDTIADLADRVTRLESVHPAA